MKSKFAGLIIVALCLCLSAPGAGVAAGVWPNSHTVSGTVSDGGSYSAEISVDRLNLRAGETVTVRASVEIFSPGLLQHQDEMAGVYGLLTVERLFDEWGNWSFGRAPIGSSFLSQTGEPVLNGGGFLDNKELGGVFTSPLGSHLEIIEADKLDTDTADKTVSAEFEYAISIPREMPGGWYRFRVDYGVKVDDNTWVTLQDERPDFISAEYVDASCARSPVVKITADASQYPDPSKRPPADTVPRLPWVLFYEREGDAISGAVASQDSGHYALTSFASDENMPILPSIDENNVQIWYPIEPAIPALHNDYVDQNNPILPLNYQSGGMRCAVTNPTGFSQDLASKAFRSEGEFGPGVGSDGFRWAFSGYGEYVINCEGYIEDIWGNRYEGGGDYKVMVARELELELSTPDGMFLVNEQDLGDTVRVTPGFPADVMISVNYWEGDKDRRYLDRSLSGQANEFGVFQPSAAKKSLLWKSKSNQIRFDKPGEYNVEVVAQYREESGTLWRGYRSFSSVVLDPEHAVKLIGGSGRQEDRLGSYFIPPAESGSVIKTSFDAKLVPQLSFPDVSSTYAAQRLSGIREMPHDRLAIPSSGTAGVNPYAFPERLAEAAYLNIYDSGPPESSVAVTADQTYRPPLEDLFLSVPSGTLSLNNLYVTGVVRRLDDVSRSQFGYYTGTLVRHADFDQAEVVEALSAPLLTGLDGEEYYMVLGRSSLRPGDIYYKDDKVPLEGLVLPAVPANVRFSIKKPGDERWQVKEGLAEINGFVQPEKDAEFKVDAGGVWEARVEMTYGQESRGGLLGYHGGKTFPFFVMTKDEEFPLGVRYGKNEFNSDDSEFNISVDTTNYGLTKGTLYMLLVGQSGMLHDQAMVPLRGGTASVRIDPTRVNREPWYRLTLFVDGERLDGKKTKMAYGAARVLIQDGKLIGEYGPEPRSARLEF